MGNIMDRKVEGKGRKGYIRTNSIINGGKCRRKKAKGKGGKKRGIKGIKIIEMDKVR